jgi:hypothetical protein
MAQLANQKPESHIVCLLHLKIDSKEVSIIFGPRMYQNYTNIFNMSSLVLELHFTN